MALSTLAKGEGWQRHCDRCDKLFLKFNTEKYCEECIRLASSNKKTRAPSPSSITAIFSTMRSSR
jgi:hypothetical protein